MPKGISYICFAKDLSKCGIYFVFNYNAVKQNLFFTSHMTLQKVLRQNLFSFERWQLNGEILSELAAYVFALYNHWGLQY